MRYISCFLVLVFAAVLSNTTAQTDFQPAPVEKSKQKILFEGKVYYIHKVLDKQTLMAISRAYGVTLQDIAAANPNVLLEVISEGQTLLVPEISSLNEFSESYYGLTKKDFHYHKVKPQQTIHFISKKYNVSREDIYYYNPGTEDVIQIDQVLKIPKKHVLKARKGEVKPEKIDTSGSYIVKKGDTLYSLSKKFNTTVAELIRINPDLRWGLKEGMVLNLTADAHLAAFNPFSDSLITKRSPDFKLFSETECDSALRNTNIKSIKIALMLPFHANEILSLDTITNDSVRKSHPHYKYLSRGISFTEFYEGFLLAIDSIQQLGINVTLFTYDTKSDSGETANIIKELDIIKPDIIFGPIVPGNITLVSEYSTENKTTLVLPLTSNKRNITKNNPYAIKLLPNPTTELNTCADYLSQFHDKNIILIHNEDSAGTARINEFKETLLAYFSSKASFEKALYKEIRVNDTIEQNLEHTLRENMDNVVFVVSMNEAYVSNIIGMLRINQSFGYSIHVVGMPIWQSFKNLRIELLHQLNTVLYTPFYIDYTKKETKVFIKNCRNKLGHEPYKTVSTGKGFNFTYLGYETGLLFTQAFSNYGTGFLKCLCNLSLDMPQTTYKFRLDEYGGFSNTFVNFINYTTEYKLEPISFQTLNEIDNPTGEEEEEANLFNPGYSHE